MTTPKAIQELVAWDEGTDPPIDQLEVAVGHASFGDTPKRAPYTDIVQAAINNVLLGTELLPTTGWTATGWTGNSVDGYVHTAGNTTALLNSLAAIVDNLYQISFIVSAWTAGTFTVAFGGITSGAYAATSAFNIKATGTDSLSIAPTTDFDGTITISIKQITWELTAVEILALLEVDDVVSAAAIAGKVDKVTGKSLVYDTIIAKLPQSYTINLPAAANLTSKVAAATETTDYPTGWTLAVTDSVNLTVTHGLAKEIDHVTVKKVVGAVKTILDPKSTAYSQVKATTTSILVIEGIDPTATQTLIHLTFMP